MDFKKEYYPCDILFAERKRLKKFALKTEWMIDLIHDKLMSIEKVLKVLIKDARKHSNKDSIERNLDRYIIRACNIFGFEVNDIKEAEFVLRNKNRKRELVYARYTIFTLIRANSKSLKKNASLHAIGKRFNISHSTVHVGIKRIRDFLENEYDMYNETLENYFNECSSTKEVNNLMKNLKR